MREIKFRAWDKSKTLKEQMMYGGDLEGIIERFSIPRERKHFEWLRQLEWMQYTGLKDKNGKEIYEGDILRWNERYEGQVYWDKDGWAVKNFWRSSQDEPGRAFSENAEFEVIGNIYENPELLNN